MVDIRSWFRRQIGDPQVVTLVLIVLALAGTIFFFGEMLLPLLAAVVIAYLLEGLVQRLERRGLPHLVAVLTVFLVFFAFMIFAAFGLLPSAFRQLALLVSQAPKVIGAIQEQLALLPQRFSLITDEQVDEMVGALSTDLVGLGQTVAAYSPAAVVTALTLGVYLLLVPILVFFFLKDKDKILAWFAGFLPTERPLANQVWEEVDAQIGNYARGKMWEILVVGSITFAVFRLLGLQYALLLSVLTGFSVLIPYIGALVVAIPVGIVAYLQWGITPDFWWVVVSYGVIQFLDGNLLVPLLFSEAVNLHPVAIIAAVLVFGGMWGFWGVFFAIPLATVIQAMLRAWPTSVEALEESGASATGPPGGRSAPAAERTEDSAVGAAVDASAHSRETDTAA
jgi:putative permease